MPNVAFTKILNPLKFLTKPVPFQAITASSGVWPREGNLHPAFGWVSNSLNDLKPLLGQASVTSWKQVTGPGFLRPLLLSCASLSARWQCFSKVLIGMGVWSGKFPVSLLQLERQVASKPRLCPPETHPSDFRGRATNPRHPVPWQGWADGQAVGQFSRPAETLVLLAYKGGHLLSSDSSPFWCSTALTLKPCCQGLDPPWALCVTVTALWPMASSSSFLPRPEGLPVDLSAGTIFQFGCPLLGRWYCLTTLHARVFLPERQIFCEMDICHKSY
jgi:hypothetical protein